MIQLPISLNTFLQDHWQQKPLLIRNGLPNFSSPISPEELAGLSLESEIESRIVIQHGDQDYELRNGPFAEDDYASLPEKDWTLLIQGMDRLIPEVHDLLTHFDFIPRWRIDDIMISYAAKGGNVGPHYDHYDVFLLQAQGERRWEITSQGCTQDNYVTGVDLRLMKTFEVEDSYVCQPGDILYLPPKWGHHGISLTDDCMTFSIGYRTYKGLELWDSLGDYFAENDTFNDLFEDPTWSEDGNPGEIPQSAARQAQRLLSQALKDPERLHRWFGRFATQLDQNAASQLPDPLSEEELPTYDEFCDALRDAESMKKDPVCRFAYAVLDEGIQLYLNGSFWDAQEADPAFIKALCNENNVSHEALINSQNHALLWDLWKMQFLVFSDQVD